MSAPQSPSLVSFIVPCYNEAENVKRLYHEMDATFSGAGMPLELVFVDDGSKEGTFAAIQDVAAEAAISGGTTCVQGIRFSRNFGKDAAVYAGLEHATGEVMGIIDADLQQSPEDALAMVRLLGENPEVDCVAAYQSERRPGPGQSLHRAFYHVLSWLSDMDVVQDASDFRVFTRHVANAILSMPEALRFTKGIFAWVGFTTLPYPYIPRERAAGESKFSFRKSVSYAMDGAFAFSVKPLRLATVLGFAVSIFAIVYMLVIVIRALIVGIETPGYVTTIGVVLLLGGIQLLMLGIIGEYLARAYLEGKQRPIYLVKDVVRGNPHDSGR